MLTVDETDRRVNYTWLALHALTVVDVIVFDHPWQGSRVMRVGEALPEYMDARVPGPPPVGRAQGLAKKRKAGFDLADYEIVVRAYPPAEGPARE